MAAIAGASGPFPYPSWYMGKTCHIRGQIFSSAALWPDSDSSSYFSALTYRLMGAACMGVFWQQLAGLGHDLGHSGVTHDFHLDHRIGSTLSALMGLSTCWWKSRS